MQGGGGEGHFTSTVRKKGSDARNTTGRLIARIIYRIVIRRGGGRKEKKTHSRGISSRERREERVIFLRLANTF